MPDACIHIIAKASGERKGAHQNSVSTPHRPCWSGPKIVGLCQGPVPTLSIGGKGARSKLLFKWI